MSYKKNLGTCRISEAGRNAAFRISCQISRRLPFQHCDPQHTLPSPHQA
uniref:Uncharacterized protein n=1 Tax=Arundo donax TaxID=35708 RepID=A0A0A9HJH5_ARUDO